MLHKAKDQVKDLLANPAIRRRYELAQQTLAKAVASSRAASHVFHTVAPIRFSREQHAVAAGQKRYYDKLGAAQSSAPALRRNTHRLEKGLLMRPARRVFALDYLGETLEFFATALHAPVGTLDQDEIQWAYDVLSAYFARVEGQPEVERHAALFNELVSTAPVNIFTTEAPVTRTPYKRGNEPVPVDYEAFLELSMRRRSVRWFKQEPVERELIDKALMVARQAPTACNRMPYEFLVFDDPELSHEIAGIPFGTAGYSENIPVTVVLVGQLDNYFSPRDRHAIYVDTSLAAMSFMYALETLGLSSCAINWPDFEPLERKMADRLGLEPHERPIMLMAVGYADPEGEVAFSEKKALDTFRHYNRTSVDRRETIND